MEQMEPKVHMPLKLWLRFQQVSSLKQKFQL